MKNINILVACEESQRVCISFRELGFNAYSCDLQACSGGRPEWHFKEDCLKVINDKGGKTESGEKIKVNNWDLLIGHPPCTYLAVTGQWCLKRPDKFPGREQQQKEAIEFFMALINSNIEHIAIENPVCIMSSKYRKPDQIIHPYYFGDEAKKTTCLWLKNLPKLEKTNIVSIGKIYEYNGKKYPLWLMDALKCKTADERRKARSKTFWGIARAFARQWGDYLIEEKKGGLND